MKNLTVSDEQFNNNVLYLMRLTQKAHILFKSSKVTQKRKLLNFAFSNLKLKDGLLGFNLKPALNAMLEASKRSNWLPLVDVFRKKHYQEIISMTDYINEDNENCGQCWTH